MVVCGFGWCVFFESLLVECCFCIIFFDLKLILSGRLLRYDYYRRFVMVENVVFVDIVCILMDEEFWERCVII